MGTVRVKGAELGYDTDVDFVFPVGLGVFKAGGGLSYHHGGTSLQELVIPVLSFRLTTTEPEKAKGKGIQLAGCPDKITNRTFGVRVSVEPDFLLTEPVARYLAFWGSPFSSGQMICLRRDATSSSRNASTAVRVARRHRNWPKVVATSMERASFPRRHVGRTFAPHMMLMRH